MKINGVCDLTMYLYDLPDEILKLIIERFNTVTQYCNFVLVCKRFKTLITCVPPIWSCFFDDYSIIRYENRRDISINDFNIVDCMSYIPPDIVLLLAQFENMLRMRKCNRQISPDWKISGWYVIEVNRKIKRYDVDIINIECKIFLWNILCLLVKYGFFIVYDGFRVGEGFTKYRFGKMTTREQTKYVLGMGGYALYYNTWIPTPFGERYSRSIINIIFYPNDKISSEIANGWNSSLFK